MARKTKDVDPEGSPADIVEDAEEAHDPAAAMKPAELLNEIRSELGSVDYTDHRGHFDTTMARVHALLALLEAKL